MEIDYEIYLTSIFEIPGQDGDSYITWSSFSSVHWGQKGSLL